MKKRYSIVLCFLIIFSLVVSVSAVSAVPAPVLDATESVVRVLAEYTDGYATGSGFVIKSDKEETLIATNYHVVEGNPYSISVWIGENETATASILAYTSQKDLCILSLAYPIELEALDFAKNEASQGDAVYAVGFPGAADYLSDKEAHTSSDATITNGIVSAIREATVSTYGTPVTILQINAAINSGNSGGPLFNADGEVVGINTYGIDDSQGIFGAIAISELKSFLADNSIVLSNTAQNSYWLIIAIAFVIATCIAIVIIMLRKNQMKHSKKNESNALSLREYMENHPNGIGTNDAVAMLLPVALQLRDLHNNGNAHLQVSPNTISIGSKGTVLSNATAVEADRYASGYAAPEIYKGASAGNLSDIYSFCAVLSYVATGKQPINSLSRADTQQEEETSPLLDSAFAEILETGMALATTSRFASMQDVILKLSPYNIKPFVNAPSESVPHPSKKPKNTKSKKSTKLSVFAIAIVLEVALVVTYLGCFFGAQAAAKQGNFEVADKLLFIPPVTRLHSRELVSYVEAGQLMADRQYAESKQVFLELNDYLDSDNLYFEVSCRQALQYADAGEFDEAIKILIGLDDAGYQGAIQKLLDIQYRKGIYLLQEEQNYKEASLIFSELESKGYASAEEMYKEAQYQWGLNFIEKEFYTNAYTKFLAIQDYADSKEILEALAEAIFLHGQELYYEGDFYSAKVQFSYLTSVEETKAYHLDSKNYLVLIDAQTSEGRIFHPEETAEQLAEIFYFEDASTLLLASHNIAQSFLLGNWQGDGYYFEMDEDGGISYDLPWFEYGDYYKIENGLVSLYPEEDEFDTRDLFYIEAIDPNCIQVYCYKNSCTYTLFRE